MSPPLPCVHCKMPHKAAVASVAKLNLRGVTHFTINFCWACWEKVVGLYLNDEEYTHECSGCKRNINSLGYRDYYQMRVELQGDWTIPPETFTARMCPPCFYDAAGGNFIFWYFPRGYSL